MHPPIMDPPTPCPKKRLLVMTILFGHVLVGTVICGKVLFRETPLAFEAPAARLRQLRLPAEDGEEGKVGPVVETAICHYMTPGAL